MSASHDARIPGAPRYDLILRQGRPWGEEPALDVAIRDGRIVATGAHLPGEAAEERPLEGRTLLPAFVEPHIHLDKAFTARSAGASSGVAEASRVAGVLLRGDSAVAGSLDERAMLLATELRRHGVCAVRTHVNVGPSLGLGNLERVLALAERLRPGLRLQVVAFAERGMEPGGAGWDILAEALAMGCVAVGGSTTHRADPEPFVAEVLALAARSHRAVDLHLDEHLDPRCAGLRALLCQTRRFDYSGRVVAGHCCALGAADDATRRALIDDAADLAITVAALPLTNLYLQGRTESEAGDDTAAGRRGLAPVRDLLRAGVRVVCGSDNVQDPFLPYGNGDPLLALTVLGIAAQLTSPEERAWLMRAMTTESAAALGLRDHSLEPGCSADLVVLDGPAGIAPCTAPVPRFAVLAQGRPAGGREEVAP